MIGLVLLVILAIVLVLLLLLLFHPLVYRIKGEKQEKLYFHMRISWLFPFLYGNVIYQDKLSCKLYLFGIPIYDMLSKNEEKDGRKAKQKTNKNEDVEKNRKKKENQQAAENQNGNQREIVNKNENEIEKAHEKIDENRNETVSSAKAKMDEKEICEKQSIYRRTVRKISGFFRKVKLFFQKLFEKIKNIKYTILNVKDKLEHVQESIVWYYEVLSREESKQAIEKGKKQIVRLLKHIKPKRVKGNVLFGFSDPAVTGEVLGFLSMFYPIMGNHISVIPDFEREVFLGDFFVKGRIRIFNLLQICWNVMFDEDIKTLYNILTGGKKHE